MWQTLFLLDDSLPLLPEATPLQVGERVHISERVSVERHPIDPKTATSGPAQRHHMRMEVDVDRAVAADGQPLLRLTVTGGWLDTARGQREPHPLSKRSFVLGPGFQVMEETGAPATSEAIDRVVGLLAWTVHGWAAVDASASFQLDVAQPTAPAWPAAGPVRWLDGPALPVHDDAPLWRDAAVTLNPGRSDRRTVEITHEVKDSLASIDRVGVLEGRATYRAHDARLIHMHIAIHDTALVEADGTIYALDAGTSRARVRVRWYRDRLAEP